MQVHPALWEVCTQGWCTAEFPMSTLDHDYLVTFFSYFFATFLIRFLTKFWPDFWPDIQCTVLLGRRNTVYIPWEEKHSFRALPYKDGNVQHAVLSGWDKHYTAFFYKYLLSLCRETKVGHSGTMDCWFQSTSSTRRCSRLQEVIIFHNFPSGGRFRLASPDLS